MQVLRPLDRVRDRSLDQVRDRLRSMRATILLIEDDASTAVPLIIGLQDQGFRALHAGDDHKALELARVAQPDLVLLDADPSASPSTGSGEASGQGLPQMDGFAVCRTLRRDSAVPIIMLAARGQGRDRVRGLEIGADAYLVEPFSFRELLAQIRALLRRRELDRGQMFPPRDRITVGDIVLDRAARQAWRAGQLIKLRRREFDLLCVLMEKAGQAISRHELLDQVWGEDWIGDPRTVDVHICWVRQKLEASSSSPCYIQTVHGYGYRFVDPALRQPFDKLKIPAQDTAASPAIAA